MDVLKEAMSFLVWNTDCNKNVNGTYEKVPSSDDVIALAQKFYKFVEVFSTSKIGGLGSFCGISQHACPCLGHRLIHTVANASFLFLDKPSVP